MVYTGQPSKGCGTCRKRRIKCDEGKPECNNCIRIKQKCPGYKNHFDLAWRDQTSVAKKGVERGKQKRRAPRERETKDVQSYAYNDGTIMIYETDLDTASSVSSSSSPQSVFTPACQSLYSPESTRSPNSPVDSFDPDLQAIVPPAEECDPYLTLLRPIPEEQALCFFFNTYVLPVRDPLARKGFLEYLGPFYTKADSTSPVKMSTLAVAASMMATRLGQSPDTALSRSYYLRAVSRMKEHIAKQDGTASDELLVAVMLLQFYEASLGFLTKRTSNPHPHLDGALALIRHRGLSNFKDKVSKSILFYIRSLLIDEAFRSSSPLPRDVQSWSDLVSDAGQLPSFRLDTINIDLRNLQASAFSLIQSPLINSKLRDGQITKMIKSAISIDSRLAEWAESLPMHWSPIRVSDPELVSPTLQLYQEHCDVYKTVFISSMWNKLRLSQLQVQTIILACLAQQPQTPLNLAQQEVCQTCIQQLADDICASIPFFLGDRTEPGRAGDGGTTYPRAPDQPPGPDHFQTPPAMGGWSLMVPLRTLMGMDIKLRPGQREWIGGQMERTGKIYHIGKKK